MLDEGWRSANGQEYGMSSGASLDLLLVVTFGIAQTMDSEDRDSMIFAGYEQGASVATFQYPSE